jgi:hypothetical protein
MGVPEVVPPDVADTRRREHAEPRPGNRACLERCPNRAGEDEIPVDVCRAGEQPLLELALAMGAEGDDRIQ